MFDFDKLKSTKKDSKIIDPLDIFRRLPKPLGINDLYGSQTEVLKQWFERREERDLVIKLHTGGGKTLVGLLIAQSIMNETGEPVLYLCPTKQLISQTLEKANEYGVSAVPYKTGEDLPRDFTSVRSVLVCSYTALFNGKSKFGVVGNSVKDVIKAGGIILDDAHVAYSAMRESFSLKVDKEKSAEDYEYLTTLFRDDFRKYGKIGSYDDIVSGSDHSGIIDVPYWAWKEKTRQVREYIQAKSAEYPMTWSFIRDMFDYSHCLISQSSLVVTPLYPPVDLIPTFENCERRIYMSATISDDSMIVRTFNANKKSLLKPISSESLAGVSERMILSPELTNLGMSISRVKKLTEFLSGKHNVSSVILTPSSRTASEWTEIGEFADNTDKVAEFVSNLQLGKSKGPYIFANRYDGIDLPNDACRLLILAGLPRGANEYDNYRSSVFIGGEEFKNNLAQRIEQGIGRAARGGGDYCVILIVGPDVTSWIDRPANQNLLTSSTRAQLEIGTNLTNNIENTSQLLDVILSCLQRDDKWKKYHAEQLAELVAEMSPVESPLKFAAVERKSFHLLRRNLHDDAIHSIKKFIENEAPDLQVQGWLQQLAARIALYHDRTEDSQEYQKQAYQNNSNLHRPLIDVQYDQIKIPGNQSKMIVDQLKGFRSKRGLSADFEYVVSMLVPTATSNQFESSLAALGSFLGFTAQRPDNQFGFGPDVLWRLNKELSLVIEAKSQKLKDNPISKKEHGQILSAGEWFKQEYPESSFIRVSMHPNRLAGDATITNETKVLTYEKLSSLVSDARTLIGELEKSSLKDAELEAKCEQMLRASNLTADKLPGYYLEEFEPKK